jgi:type IV secretory pathway VirB10-like protein
MSKDNEDQMSPSASPGGQSGGSGVRRVNNLPIYIGVGGLAIFLLIMVLVASDRAAKQNRADPQGEAPRAGNTKMFAKEVAGEQKDGIVLAKATLPPALPDQPAQVGSIAIARPPNLDAPPLPPNSQSQQPTPPLRSAKDEEADRIRMMKMQLFDEAVKARTSLSVAAPRSAASGLPGATAASALGAPPATREEALARLAAVRQQIDASTREDPTAAYKARLQQIRAAGDEAGGTQEAQGGAPKPAPAPTAGGRNDFGQFAATEQGDRWRLGSQPQPPRTPYELRAGFVVPATLISGVNAELPGQIMAQVSQDVYDTPLGKYKLIPQGSRLVGIYSSEIAYGQSRILVAWQRIVFPDGRAMDIGAMPGADGAGYAGFKDQVNNHYFRLFSSAFLMSAVTAGIAMSQPQTGNAYARPSASSAMSEALGQQLGQTTAQLISKNLNIAPTLEIRPGYRFNVMVTKDMTFSKPYKAFDY